MEKLPVLLLLLYSIPESIILVSFSCTLYGYNIRDNFTRIMLLGSAFAMITYIVRLLPISIGQNLVIEIPVFILLTTLFLRITAIRAIFMILTSFFAIIVAETVSCPLISLLTGKTTQELIESPLWRTLTGWTSLIVILLLTLFLYKQKISLSKTASIFYPKTKRGKTQLLLTLLILAQALIAGFLNFTIYFSTTRVFPVFNNTSYIMMISVSMFAISIISGYFIRRMFLASEQETVLETYETVLDNINKLFTTVRGQRHDFLNHVNVIYGLAASEQTQEIKNYIDNLTEEVRIVNESIKVKNPVLNALLNSKLALAESSNITLETEVLTNLDGFKLKPLDMVKILGNLIDNALEAVRKEPPEFRTVRVSIDQDEDGAIFQVFNRRPVIDPDRLERIFESGFTTKENHTGLGLAVVKNLVNDKGGTIEASSDEEDGTFFTVVIPK